VSKARKQTNTERINNVFDVYVAPLFLLGVGLILIVLAFTISFPKANNLSEVRGHLSSYYFNQTGRGRDDYATIISLQEGSRFWTHAITKETVEAILKEKGVEVRFYVDPYSTAVPMDGDAVKAYGLWINGREIQSPDESISRDKVIVRFCFPAVGIFSTVIAILVYRRNKKKYAGY